MAAPANSQQFDRNSVARDLGIAAAAGGGKGALNFDVNPVQQNAPTQEVNVNELLGLVDSTKYPSLQQVGDTGYYYRDNYMYEPYTVTQSAPSYMGGIYGYGMGGGGSNRAEGTIEVGGQSFRPVENVDVAGFRAFEPEEGVTQYTPSMAYIYANTPRYEPEPLENVAVYQPATASLDQLQKVEDNIYNGVDNYSNGLLNGVPTSYGARRFLNNFDYLAGTGINPNINFEVPSVYDTTGSNTESST